MNDDLKSLVAEAELAGAAFRLSDGRVEVQGLKRLPETLMEALRERRDQLSRFLAEKQERPSSEEIPYRLKHPDQAEASDEELAEIEAGVTETGYVLLWSNQLDDLVAFYLTDVDLTKIPPGFVPYGEKELRELFGEGKRGPAADTLRLIHQAKRQGARVVEMKEDNEQ